MTVWIDGWVVFWRRRRVWDECVWKRKRSLGDSQFMALEKKIKKCHYIYCALLRALLKKWRSMNIYIAFFWELDWACYRIRIPDKLTIGKQRGSWRWWEQWNRFEDTEQGMTDWNNCVSIRGWATVEFPSNTRTLAKDSDASPIIHDMLLIIGGGAHNPYGQHDVLYRCGSRAVGFLRIIQSNRSCRAKESFCKAETTHLSSHLSSIEKHSSMIFMVTWLA